MFLRSDCTQLVRSVVTSKKNQQVVNVVGATTLPPCLDWLRKGEIDFLVSMFKEAAISFGSLYEEFYLVVPDEFVLMDCKSFDYGADENVSKERLERWTKELMNINVADYHYDFPIKYSDGGGNCFTCCCMRKDFVDLVIQAAKEAEHTLISLEPASLAYLRCINKWDEQHCILEIFEDYGTIVSFSPVAGAFRIPSERMAWNRLSRLDQEEMAQVISQEIAKHDVVAVQTFQLADTDIGIHVISPFKEQLLQVPILRDRCAHGEIPTEFVKLGVRGNVDDLIVPIGATLQSIERMMHDAFDQDS